MNKIGIIAEYNPFHLGHLYQLKKIKEQYKDSIIILITNSTFTQRGVPSIITKNDKTKIALENNIDLIVELPFAYATQSADSFAHCALKILNTLQIDTLIFGSESNDINTLKQIATIQINNKEYDNIVKKYLIKGNNYPTALNNALKELINKTIKEPNDLLGISYIKEIIKNNYKITPITIKRIGSYHGEQITSKIANATTIRKKLLKNEPINKYVPTNIENNLIKNFSINNFFPYLKYKIISTNNLSIYQTVDEGIENRIKKVITKSNSWEELVKNIKTKRYTYNKINRMLIHILTSFTKEEAQNLNIDYIRILGFNQKGQKHLNNIKKNIKIPLIYNYKKNFSKLLDIEVRATSIYNLEIPESKKINEYNLKPIINNETTPEPHHNNEKIKS